jgi:transglutaminase-like putative cysteine protease
MNRVRLHHVTEFEYDGAVSESYNEVHLQPQDDETQHCIGFRLRTNPATAPSTSRDYFGNWVHRFNIVQKHRRLRVEAESTVMVQEPSPALEQGIPLAAVGRQREALLDAHYDFIVPSTYVPSPEGIAPLLRAVEEASGGSTVGFVQAATAVVHDNFRYEKGSTHVHSSVLDVLNAGAGVCQDFAHLLIALARSRGLPARYVSGYLAPSQPTDARASLEQVIGGQASHAWVEVFVPDIGWLGLDPTLGVPASGRHIRVAYGRDYGDVAPVRGVYRGHAGQRLSVDVRVRPAVDADGCEHVRESVIRTEPEPPPEAMPQQQQQQ